MSLNYLLDENVDPSYKSEILTRNSNILINDVVTGKIRVIDN